jgi:16S rRNA (guanine(966)-N(2))-methyltransferase RsmD
MRVQLRIVAGSLRGRKLVCTVGHDLRPTPQMVREALFSILGNAVPGRPFYDIFAGTGVNGLEALSRGASSALFLERDFRQGNEIEAHLRAFGVKQTARVLRADAYRWAESWDAPPEPVNLFLSPPFADYQRRLGDLLLLISDLQRKCAPGSVLILQSERHAALDKLRHLDQWDQRRYGRNVLLIWVKPEESAEPTTPVS